MDSISSLLDQSSRAKNAQDWQSLQRTSTQILRLVYGGVKLEEVTLRDVIRNYLSSIVGTGDFLINLESQDSSVYQTGLARLFDFLKKQPHYFESNASLIQAAQEIVLLSLDPTPRNRNKSAKLLRELARPDISIIICKQILEATRLNYYSLTTLCGAYCDLSKFEEAIEVAEKALKYTPEEQTIYPLTALIRAHTLRFKATGDLADIEVALEYGRRALALKIDSYVANAFVAAAVASGNTDEMELAQEVLQKAEPQLKRVDIEALFQAYKASQELAPKASVVELVELDNESLGKFDSLVDLVTRDLGFRPEIQDLRNMVDLFNDGGWFFQGVSQMPCQHCDKVLIHSYRKHFRRYGKEMHYWAIVCQECKNVTDSVDYEKKAFNSISKDLENRFPVSTICTECQPN